MVNQQDSENLINMSEKLSRLNVVKKGGENIVKNPCVFSSDSKYLFVTTGNRICSYNVETADFVASYEGLSDDAVGVVLHPSVSDKIIAISCTGELVEWQLTKQENVPYYPRRSVKLDQGKGVFEVKYFSVVQFDDESAPCAVCVIKDKDVHQAFIRIFSVATGREISNIPAIGTESDRRSFSIRHVRGEMLLANFLNTSQNLLTYCIIKGSTIKLKKQAISSHRFTCIACHPYELCIITGDVRGCIRVWRNLLNVPKWAPYHWHTLPLETLCFSAHGTYFFSGGGECVLVRWLLDSNQDKMFVPRLGAEISNLAVSPDNLWTAVSTKDNAIHFLNTTVYVTNTIQHFSWPSLYSNGKHLSPIRMTFDPRTKALVMNGRVGHLQFFSPDQATTNFLLDVTCRNYLTQERVKVLKNTEIVTFKFNADGTWLATAEFCDDGDHAPVEARLKFWKFDETKRRFDLNTSVENPHKGKIFDICFRPPTHGVSSMCVSCGEDKKFRTWSLNENESKNQHYWETEHIGYFRNLPVKALSFSVDGSLVAVTFGPSLTIWVPGSNQLKCSLTPLEAQDDLLHVQFGQKSVHLVVTGSSQRIAVWNLLSLALMWVIDFRASMLVSDPNSDIMAAFSSGNNVVVFSPRSSEPVFRQDNVIPGRKSEILAAVFIPHLESNKSGISWQSSSQLYVFNSRKELLTFEDSAQNLIAKKRPSLDVMPPISNRPKTAFAALLANERRSDVVDSQKEEFHLLRLPGMKSLEDFVEGPAHAMAPLSLLGHSLLLSFISYKEEESYTPIWKVPMKGNKIEYSDDSDEERMDLSISNSTYEENKLNLMSKREENSVGAVSFREVDKCLSEIQDQPLDWVSQLLN